MKNLLIGIGAFATLAGGVAIIDGMEMTEQEAQSVYAQKEAQWRSEAFAPLIASAKGNDAAIIAGVLNNGAVPSFATAEDLDRIAEQVDNQLWKRRLHDYANHLRTGL